MSRLPRVVVVDVPHHVTQRGNARQAILASDADRITYLDLLRQYAELHIRATLELHPQGTIPTRCIGAGYLATLE